MKPSNSRALCRTIFGYSRLQTRLLKAVESLQPLSGCQTFQSNFVSNFAFEISNHGRPAIGTAVRQIALENADADPERVHFFDFHRRMLELGTRRSLAFSFGKFTTTN